MRTTLLGSLLDAAAPQPRARRARTCGCSRTARSTSTAGARRATPTGRRAPRLDRRCPTSATHLGALLTGRAAPAVAGASPSRRAPTSSPPRACSRRCSARCACRGASSRRASRSCTRAARRACWSAGERRRAGSASCTRPSPRAGTSSGRRRLRARPRRVLAARAASCPRYEDLTSFPAVRQDLAVVVPADVAGGRAWSRSCATPAARCCAGAEVFDVYAARRSARAALAGAAARVPRRRPHADRRGGRAAAREDRRRRWPSELGGRAAWLAVAVLGAAGYAGAIAAQLLHRHPRFELAHVTARAEAGARLDDVHPRTRVPLELEAYDPDAHGDVDAAVVAYPHGAAAPVVAELRERGVRVVDLSADFRLRDRAIYEDWYGEHGAPELFGEAVYGLPELHRDAIARRRPRRQPRLLPDRGAARARAAGARRPDRRRRDRREVRRLRRRPRADARRRTSSPPTRTSRPTRSARHRHTPEIEQELGGWARRADHVHAAPRAARPGRAGLLLRHAAREPTRTSCARSTTRPTRASRGSRSSTGPPGVLEVRETNYCRISVHGDARTGRCIVFAAIDNLWKGAASQAVQNLNLMFGRDETRGAAT